MIAMPKQTRNDGTIKMTIPCISAPTKWGASPGLCAQAARPAAARVLGSVSRTSATVHGAGGDVAPRVSSSRLSTWGARLGGWQPLVQQSQRVGPHDHLYVCVRGSLALANHLTMRDYLRRHSEAAATYGRLKQHLAKQFPTEVDGYSEGKTDFLLEILGEAGLPDDALRAIADANRTKR